MKEKIVIIGNGIAGITAARWIRKFSDNDILVISKESQYHISRPALMYVYMGHMRKEDIVPYENHFWAKNRIELLQRQVDDIDFNSKRIDTKEGFISYDKLIIATGSETTFRGWKGEHLKGVRGLYSLDDLDYIERLSPNINHAVIVGGGLIGIELAEMFRSRNMKVTILVREKSYWDRVLPQEESELVNNHIRSHHINLICQDELDSIVGTDSVKAIKTKSGNEIQCDFVGICTGVSPCVSWLKNNTLKIDKGIVVNEFLETNIPDVYAIGDCAQLNQPRAGRKPIEAIWYTGRMMGEVVAHNICRNKTSYDPGIWFNSAKFLDVEYQVYGTVPTRYDDINNSLYWQHKNKPKSIRLVYRHDTMIGFNLMGIRYRQEVCLKWIKEATHIEDVLKDLALANFDPEFFETYESHLIEQYNKLKGTKIRSRKKGVLNEVLKFLKTI